MLLNMRQENRLKELLRQQTATLLILKIQQKNSRVEKEQKKEQPESVLEKTISVVFLIPFSKRYVYNEKREVNEMNYTYILQCSDGTYYTGWTNDIAKRLKTHNEGKGAKYTRARLPVTLAYYEAFETKEEAMRREWEIKQLSRKEKEKLIY